MVSSRITTLRLTLLFLAMAGFTVACLGSYRHQRPTYTLTTPFDEQALLKISNKGTAGISGQAFLRTRGGDVKYGAGNAVYLVPSTAYTDDLMAAVARGQDFYQSADPRLGKYMKKTTADASGNFEFQELAAGEYHVLCPIYWEYVVSRYETNRTGRLVQKKVTVGDGQFIRIMLTY